MDDCTESLAPHGARWLLGLALSWWALLIICAVATAASADPELATYGSRFLIYAAGASARGARGRSTQKWTLTHPGNTRAFLWLMLPNWRFNGSRAAESFG